MGTGHVMRMIALAQAWREDGGEAVFLCAEFTPALEQCIRDEGLQLERLAVAPGSRDDLVATSAAVSRHAAADRLVAVAVDGYQFDADFQFGLKQTGCRLLVVDDYGHCDHYHADWVLNQNISACEGLYSNRALGTRLLLGPKFALLRREFMANRGPAHVVPDKARKLLVTLGGADADNVTKKVIDALVGTSLEVRVAVGGSNPHLFSLREAAQKVSRGDAKVDVFVNPSDIPQLMAWADMAVAAAGSTSWELAFSGLPTLFTILAGNQAANAWEMERQGFGLCLGEYSQFDQQRFRDSVSRVAEDRPLRADFASRGRQMVDGRGAARVARALGAQVLAA